VTGLVEFEGRLHVLAAWIDKDDSRLSTGLPVFGPGARTRRDDGRCVS